MDNTIAKRASSHGTDTHQGFELPVVNSSDLNGPGGIAEQFSD